MYNFLKKFIWSDGGYCDGVRYWFVGAKVNALFCLNLNSGEYKLIGKLPVEGINFFRNVYSCVFKDNRLIWFPKSGNNIIIYNIENKKFSFRTLKIAVDYNIGIIDSYLFEKSYFCVSCTLNEIIEFDVETMNVVAEYKIGKSIGCFSIRVAEIIYFVSDMHNFVYEFNMETKKIKIHEIEKAEQGFYLINYFNNNFVIAGYSHRIYFWNQESNNIICKDLNKFGFKQYFFESDKGYEHLPVFTESIVINENLWLLPRASQIIVIDKSNNVRILFIEDEDESKESLKRWWSEKYKIQYVRDNRYLVLYSYKNHCCFEIDTLTYSVKYKKYYLSSCSKINLMQLYRDENKLIERAGIGIIDILREYESCKYKMEEQIGCGNKIYESLKHLRD